jgi:acyl carrier protein
MRGAAASSLQSDAPGGQVSDLEARVARCFSNVFPSVPQTELIRASTTSLATWDSVAQVTLLSAIAEEFGLDFELEDYEGLTSYALIVSYLENKLQDP